MGQSSALFMEVSAFRRCPLVEISCTVIIAQQNSWIVEGLSVICIVWITIQTLQL